MSKTRPYYLEVFLVALASLLLEVSYTRVFSFKVFYFYTYLIIGVALLGLGVGGVLVTLYGRLREVALPKLVSATSLAASVVTILGYLVIAWAPLSTFELRSSPVSLLSLVVICAMLLVPFVCTGIVFSSVFGRNAKIVNRLYATDLVGAALGCVVAVPLMNAISPPGCVMLSAGCFALAAMRCGSDLSVRAVPLSRALATSCIFLAFFAGVLPDPRPDPIKLLGTPPANRGQILHTRWHSTFRIDVLSSPLVESERLVIAHDGLLGSTLHAFDGRLSQHERFESDPRSLPFAIAKPNPRVLVIGAAGGHEVLASLYFGAAHVTAVELNPATVELLTDRFADYTGHLAEHEKVDYRKAEGRYFLESTDETYDLIFFVAPDSYSAMNAATSGAFVLSESYLYTLETVKTALGRLAPDGIICMQFGEVDFNRKPNRTARYLATARAAFDDLDIEDFGSHVLVVADANLGPLNLATIIVRKRTFEVEEIAAFSERTSRVSGAVLRHPAEHGALETTITSIIELESSALARWFDNHAYDVTPVTDDRPFFWHFTRFRDLWARGAALDSVGADPEDGLGERVLGEILLFAAITSATILFAPFVAIRRQWRRFPAKRWSGLYFASLGLGFMLFEISLIQQLTLFLGYPTHSLSITLATLLLTTGAGAYMIERYGRAPERVIPIVFGILIALTLLHLWLTPRLVTALVGAPAAVRIAAAIGLVTPLGLCLGAFMPSGLSVVSRLSPHPEQYVAWAWAVNGCFSVVGSLTTTMVSMTIGFSATFLCGAAVYAFALVAMRKLAVARPVDA